jgi:hypothetical protein
MRIVLVGLPPVLTAALGIVINVATDMMSNLTAWIAVAVLTILATLVSVLADQKSSRGSVDPRRGGTRGSVQNNIVGEVKGSAVQARDIDGTIDIS